MKNLLSSFFSFPCRLVGLERIQGLAMVFTLGSALLWMDHAPAAEKAFSATTEDSLVEQLITQALDLQGTPYLYAGKTPNGFDCSGFTGYVYRQVGVTLPGSSRTQFQEGTQISLKEARRGDLVFFSIYGDRINHVGILLDTVSGKTPFVHATSSRGVRIDYLEQDYYLKRFVGARAVLDR